MSNTKPSPSTYTQGHSDEVTAAHKQRTVSTSAQFLLPHLKPHFFLLDIGCGPGTITHGFLEHLPSGSVTGVDISDSLIQQNTSTFPPSQYSNLKFEVGNVLDGLKYQDESFDVVYTHQTILHLPDPVKAMKEARRVLKPGGMLAMRESDHASWYPHYPGLDKYIDALQQMINSSGAPGFYRARELHAWAGQAGFDRAKMVVSGAASIYSSEEQRRWFAGIHVGRLRGEGVGGKLKELEILGQEEIEECVRDLEKWRDDVNGWQAMLESDVVAYK